MGTRTRNKSRPLGLITRPRAPWGALRSHPERAQRPPKAANSAERPLLRTERESQGFQGFPDPVLGPANESQASRTWFSREGDRATRRCDATRSARSTPRKTTTGSRKVNGAAVPSFSRTPAKYTDRTLRTGPTHGEQYWSLHPAAQLPLRLRPRLFINEYVGFAIFKSLATGAGGEVLSSDRS